MERLGSYADRGDIVFSTPILTNAGRYGDRPLSACIVPPVALNGDRDVLFRTIDTCHRHGMGTGFNLDTADDPVKTLRELNDVAVIGSLSGEEDRPVGNMAILSIGHPKILDFISAKLSADDAPYDWKFNISVNIPGAFMRVLANGGSWRLRDGKTILARRLFTHIAEAAHACGDPGVMFMERFERDNPTPDIGRYDSIAPCAEIGLVPGETCQFGYINLGNFVVRTPLGSSIQFDRLAEAVHLMVRALDNALEVSIERYGLGASRAVMGAKRKIGVGVCGLADLLALMELPYDSDQAVVMAKEVLSFVNYESKIASIRLAAERGSFTGMHSQTCRYLSNPSIVEERYAQHSTSSVSGQTWASLGQRIRDERQLRNCATTALPPTGRSAPIVGASTGIEPFFNLSGAGKAYGELRRQLAVTKCASTIVEQIAQRGSVSGIGEVADEIRRVFRTAKEISPMAHVRMAAAAQTFVDEAVSKTINLAAETSVEGVASVYWSGYKAGLKTVSIYRDGSRKIQPYAL